MLTAAELADMTATAEESMMDTCVIQVSSATVNGIGEEDITYTDGSAIACGVRFQSDQRLERETINGVAYEIDATVRLPKDTTIGTRDRIKVTKRYGATLAAPWVFEVIGEAQLGPTALVTRCRQAT